MHPETDDELIGRFEGRRRALVAASELRAPGLPLRYLRQTAHFTCPAGDLDKLRKAAAAGAACARLLERAGVGVDDLAAALELPRGAVEAALAGPARPELVLIDAEDASAPTPAAIAACRATALEALTAIDWGDSLLFFRPNGLELAASVADLATVVAGALRAAPVRLDGVVWPKAAHEDEVRLVCDLLGELEERAGRPAGTVRLALLVESAGGLLRLDRLLEAAGGRLCALIWGPADYASEVGLPRVGGDHPTDVWARQALVNAAAAAAVPAIDGMTFDYPVAPPSLDPPARRARVLAALTTCYRDARRALELGMAGKWVGHPLQLLPLRLAAREATDPQRVTADVEAARAYARAVAADQGAIMLGERMADRATDRHVRTRLRRALAHGALDPAVAAELGL